MRWLWGLVPNCTSTEKQNTVVVSCYKLCLSFGNRTVVEHQTVSVVMVRLSCGSSERVFHCCSPATKNALTTQKALTGFYNAWVSSDEDVELHHVEETAMNAHRFLHYWFFGFFLMNPWLEVVQLSDSAPPPVAGLSLIINRNSWRACFLLTPSTLLISKEGLGTRRWQ